MKQLGVKVLAAVAVLAITGCAHGGRSVPTVDEQEPYRIGREDVLDVSVWRDGDLSRTVPVRPDGYISLPIVGELLAAGKTPNELADSIREELAPYVQQPKVTVIVREVNSTRVFVTGEVARPGAYPLRGRMSLLQAIALAGGFSDFARRDAILVIRRGEQGGHIPVRYTDLVSERPAEEERRRDFLLRPGDTVVVP